MKQWLDRRRVRGRLPDGLRAASTMLGVLLRPSDSTHLSLTSWKTNWISSARTAASPSCTCRAVIGRRSHPRDAACAVRSLPGPRRRRTSPSTRVTPTSIAARWRATFRSRVVRAATGEDLSSAPVVWGTKAGERDIALRGPCSPRSVPSAGRRPTSRFSRASSRRSCAGLATRRSAAFGRHPRGNPERCRCDPTSHDGTVEGVTRKRANSLEPEPRRRSDVWRRA